jgi:Fe-S-cluster containining protein
MSWVDEICLSCGVCCTTVSIVRIQPEDLERLMRGYNLTREQAHGMLRRDPGELRILMEKTAACPALSSKGGRYLCHAYEHRPGICREYECYILDSAKDWMKTRSENREVEERNPFHSAQDENELSRQVQDSVKRLRSNFLNLCVTHGNDEGFRKPDYMPELIRTLSGAEFENSFPPRETALSRAPEIHPAKR